MGPGGKQAEILIVDNDERIVELVAWFLKKRGYAVRTAVSFRDARRAIADRPPTLMLSDVELGTENALDELPRLAREGVLPPTLVVSGYLDPQTVRTLESLEAVVGTLAKPFDFPVLEQRITAALAGPSGAAPAPGAMAARGQGPGSGVLEEDEEGWTEIRPVPRRTPFERARGE